MEQRIREIGHELFRAAHTAQRGWPTRRWVANWFLQLSMRDELVKTELFRFVDLLPALRTPTDVNEHVRECLVRVRNRLPAPLAGAVAFWPQVGWLGEISAAFVCRSVEQLARRFIPAPDTGTVAAVASQLRHRGLAVTVDLLGEAVLAEAEALAYQQRYLALIDQLTTALAVVPEVSRLDCDQHGSIPRVNISLKLSSLFSQFDPIAPTETSAAVRDRLRPILRFAKARHAFVNFDMEHFAYKELIFRIFRDVLTETEFRDWADVGIAVQAYLRETAADLDWLCRWAEQRGTPVWVRLVKGAYWDYEIAVAVQHGWIPPVFTEKSETDAAYETATAFLIENHETLQPAFATHNIRTIAAALALAERHRLPPLSFEFQMLYGMAEPIQTALVNNGQRVRLYTPVGELLPGMAYFVRRLLENTSNQSFLRASFLEHLPEEELLMKPTHSVSSTLPTTAEPFHNEPIADFSRPETRAAMQAALTKVSTAVERDYPIVIGGQRIETGQWLESRDPSHRQRLVGRAARATVQQIQSAVTTAGDAFVTWRNTSPAERADLLRRVATIIRRRRFELAAWEIVECGKPWREADADVCEAIDFCEFYAADMLRLAVPRRSDMPGETNVSVVEPRGVAVVIAPWNFPLAILAGMTSAAIVTGNTVIMKPAEQSPIIAAHLMKIFEEAGLPAGVVNYLPGVGAEIGPALVQHPAVALIVFTGSRAVGVAIQQLAAAMPPGQTHLKHVICEMGGKNAIIVDDDADLDEATRGVTASAFGYAGQKYSACSRVIVLDSVYEAFLTRLVEAARSLRLAPADDPDCGVGPVIDAEARERILVQLEQAKRVARLVLAATPGSLADEGWFVGPHIFADVPPKSALAQEEIFGPVLAVLQARNFDEALRLANGTVYALTGGLYSRRPDHIDQARREFRVGNLYINRKITGAVVARQPFGGFKLSGSGSKAGGPDYLPQFVWSRTITENTMRHGFIPPANSDRVGEEGVSSHAKHISTVRLKTG